MRLGPKPPPSPESQWSVPTLATWLTEKKKARRWLIPHFIPIGGLVLMSGHQKRSMKTFMADMLSVCGSTKTSHSMITPTHAFPILYVEEEGGEAGTQNTFEAQCKGAGVKMKDLTQVYYAFHNRVTLDTSKWRDNLVRKIEETKAELVILDAMTYLHEGDENSTADMVKVVNTLQTLRAAGPAVLFLAHLNTAQGEDPTADIDRQVRGSGAIVNAYDLHIALRRYKDTQKWIDCTIRERHGPQQQYRVFWDLDLNPDKSIKKACCRIQPVDNDPKSDRLQDMCVAKLEPGSRYTNSQMTELWEIDGKLARAVRDELITQKVLEKVGNSYTLT